MWVKMLFNKRGVVLITVIIWIVIIGAIVIYGPGLYSWYVEQNKIRIIKSNVESVENEMKSELLEKHPVIIWNDIDNLFRTLSVQNPITKAAQTKNGWSRPGDVVVYFDGETTFTIDGIGPDGNMLHLNIVIKK
jgi:Tfp pilus assembly major pilin PilA